MHSFVQRRVVLEARNLDLNHEVFADCELILVLSSIFHVFFGIYFWHYSPGTITAVLLYLGLNGFVLQRAVDEGWADYRTLTLLFFGGTVVFYLFEFIGPVVILFCVSFLKGDVI